MLRRLFALTLATSALASSAYAVELRDATNQQLLDELAYRLRVGGGGGGNSARAMYSCDSSSYLQISVVNQSGTETNEQVYIGNGTTCNSQAQTLNTHRARITDTTIAAVCDSSTYLKRFSITRDGAMSELQSRYIGNMSNCLTQAETINTGN